jgi:hypothetical protein
MKDEKNSQLNPNNLTWARNAELQATGVLAVAPELLQGIKTHLS